MDVELGDDVGVRVLVRVEVGAGGVGVTVGSGLSPIRTMICRTGPS